MLVLNLGALSFNDTSPGVCNYTAWARNGIPDRPHCNVSISVCIREPVNAEEDKKETLTQGPQLGYCMYPGNSLEPGVMDIGSIREKKVVHRLRSYLSVSL